MSDKQDAQSLDQQNDLHDEELEGYSFVKTLGKGNFGKVKLGVHVLTGEHVAIKILEKDLIFEKADIQRISRQIKIMKLIRHPNIIQLYQIIQVPKRLYLIMQYADGGDLFDLIVKSEKLNEQKASNYFAQTILGLEYLHSKGVAHRDMKPENILISKNKIKIADFGLGNFFNQGQMLKTACGSPCYASPEMLQRVPYNPEKIDIWSSGIILYAMVCGYLPFEDDNTSKLYEKIKTLNPRYPKSLSEGLKNILKKILDKNPQSRLNINGIKEEPWIKAQFQKQKITQFEVNTKELQKICETYGIKEAEKLGNYLKKNKHNNLTTIYYLATKARSDDNEVTQSNNSSVPNSAQPQRQKESKISEQINQNTQTIEMDIEIKTEQKEENPNQNEKQGEITTQKQKQKSKGGSIKNEISFSQFQQFSVQSEKQVSQNLETKSENIKANIENEKEKKQKNDNGIDEEKQTDQKPKIQVTIQDRTKQKEQQIIKSPTQNRKELKEEESNSKRQEERTILKPDQIHKNPIDQNINKKPIHQKDKGYHEPKTEQSQNIGHIKKNRDKKIQVEKPLEKQDKSIIKKNVLSHRNSIKLEQSKVEPKQKQGQNLIIRKPKLLKNSRMQTIKMDKDLNKSKASKTPALVEHSHSRDRPITTKKIIGKQIMIEPFLIDAGKIILCSWESLSSILSERGAEGKVQYFSFSKTCIYITKQTLKGIRSLKEIIQKINSGQIE